VPHASKLSKHHFAIFIAVVLALLATQAQQPSSTLAADTSGWTSLFQGTSLDGWDGRADVWKVEDGAITGEVAAGPSSVTDTTYIFWKGGKPSDFDFKADVKTTGAFVNTGLVYRGYVVSPPAARAASPPSANGAYKLGGPQLDFDAADRYCGQYFEIATGRGLLARRGQIVEVRAGAKPALVGSLGDDKTMSSYVKPGDWNQLRVIAHGNTIVHMINGRVVAVLIDEDTDHLRSDGLLAFQLEGAGKVQFRNIWLKTD
jgi:hypothetical protein